MNTRIWKPQQQGNPCPGRYYYQFFQRKARFRGVLDSRNMEQASLEVQTLWDQRWNKKFDPDPIAPKPVRLFEEFVKETYLPWSKSHKKGSYGDDVRITTMLSSFFDGKTLVEIKPAMIEQFKDYRAGKAPATINRELSVLSKVFTLAVRHEQVESNPGQNVPWTMSA